MESCSASCRSDLEHEEQEQAEPSRYEIQFMPTRSTTAITAASQRIEEGSTADLSGVEFSLSLDPTPAPSLLTSQSASHPPVSSSADSETTSIGGSNKRAGAWPQFGRKSQRTNLGQSEKTSRSPFAVGFGRFLQPPLALSPSSDAADDGGGRGHSAEVIEKEHLFDKVLTPSDVGKLNRLVIPKHHAEKFFPLNAAANEKGLLFSCEDRTGKLWRFRYSYWNTSQSYVLTKGWSRFVKEKRLDAGDTVSFCRGAAEATRGRLFIDYRRRADVRDPHRLPDLPLPLPMGSGGFFMPPAAPAKLYYRSVLPWDLGSINIDASSTGSAPLAHMKPPPSLFSGFGETSRHFFSDSKRRKDGRDPHRLPGIPLHMQSVSRMPFRSTAGMNSHAPVAQPPPAMPKLKLVDPSSPSLVIPSSIKRLFQQLVQVRTIILSLGRAPLSDAWLAAVEYLASDAQLCLQDLHYLMLLARLGINHKKARSNDAGSSSKATPAGSFQFGHAVDDKIRKITSILETLINGGLELPRAVVRDDGDMLSVVAMLSHCILLCRGISGITSVICVENMKDHQEFPVAACDDLTCSGHGKIARMNAQTIPTCVADPIYLLPTAIRSLLYLDLSSCSDLTELPASLGTLHNLSALNLSSCFSLYMLPESLGSLECLQILVLSFCWKLLFLPLSFGNLSKLRLLDISGCSSLEILPDSFVNLVHLENLNLSDCKRLKGIPQPFGNLQKLKYLNFSGCNKVELQVEYIRGLANLKCLTLSPQTDVHGFPDSVEYLSYHLDLSRWWKKNWVHPNCKPKAASLHSYGDHEQSIIGRLLSQGSYDGDVTSEQSVTSICIVGESGMGKTELVHRVYNDQMILDAFNLRIWICMCDKKKLLEKIIEFITGTYCGEAPLSVLEETVREELIGKRFLLVLDDADIEEQCFWSDVLKLLNVGAEGSALIVTTKSEEVGCLVGERQTIYLNSLSEEECFMVFQDHAFGDLDMNNYSHLANVGWKIVEKCGGNPMCVKALSGLLCHSENGLPEIGALVDGIMPALRLCYDLLPAHLKRCFKFCSLFPKDYIFVKHYIVRLWISQGFIFPEEDRQPEDTGLHYFNELFCRSFFQRFPFHNDQEDKFVVHDLFHDLAHSVSRDECFRSEEPFCRLPENICHLSLVFQDSKTVVLSKEVTHLQSLLVVGRSDSRCSSTYVPVLNILHLNDIFVQGGFLSALNLSCAEILELPRSVGNMKHLRFLALNNTKINSLPSEIGQIDILETLELKDCCDLIELPESTKNLAKLRHLDVRKGPGNVHVGMPSGVGQLTDLQTLAILNVGNDLLHCCIGDLKNLNGLRGHLRITGLENIKTGKDAREANLMGKHSIEALTMEWCYNSEEMEDDLCKEIANQVLQNLQPNSSLQELVFRNYSGNLFPTWMQDSSLCKLVSITIDDCKYCNELPSLGDLPYLKYLFIQKMNATNIIGYKSNSLATEEKHAPRFPSLEILNLWEMYDLQSWDGISDGDFPRLCRLSISRCPKLKNLPPFMSLLHLSFHFGGELPTFSELPMLKSLKIEGFHKLKSISLSLEMLMLKKLEISDCKELLSVDAPWLSLSHLKVARCPKFHFRGCSLEGCFLWEMLLSGSPTKRSLLVKNMSDTDLHDDGWNWKKYDEKDILGSKFRRSYFRCNKYSMGCMARKTAERNNDDPNTWSVTYVCEHNHPQGDVPCIEPSPDLPIQLGTTRKRKEFHAHPFNSHESSTSNKM